MSLIQLIDFKILGDERGSLVSLEQNKNIPFDIKRVYYLFDTKSNEARGFHAHKALRQVGVCVKGSCSIKMDNGLQQKTVVLNSSEKGLLIDVMQWHEMYDFSGDCVFMVLASDYYDEEDYIRDYDEFIRLVKSES
ncbi:MAG: dTDP-6-deoxy-3,4-keto-hexulose isomerase [Gammaproteobacteria bacterium]|nr:MAG: dTDP-6-deoxy-3,4-keto-hexulose isomerase [Gammaproteobacteria bacterium]